MKIFASTICGLFTLGLVACDRAKPVANTTPTPVPAGETTGQRVAREARETAGAAMDATREVAGKAADATREAAKKAEPALEKAGAAIKDAASNVKEKIHEATAPTTPTPTPPPTPVQGS